MISEMAQYITNVVVILGFLGSIIAVLKKLRFICNGQMCQLRSDITATYYRHADEEAPTLREYERKNLDDLYEAYKALGGNHFIDDLYETMRGWKVSI